MTDSFLLLAFIFLVAGVVAVPLASKFGLGSVLGYLIAGIAISPLLTSLHVNVESLQHFAEFGVVMMLFLVGLELQPKMLWKMRHKLLGLGGLQVSLTTLLVMVVAMFFGQVWSVALAVGLVFSLSSTAIVLQTLNEKGQLKSDGGQASFSVLLFQDIAVIPMLALIPLLAMPELLQNLQSAGAAAGVAGHGSQVGFVEGLPGWQHTIITILAIGGVVVGGNYLTEPVFRFIAIAKLRELFSATALMMVIGIALLMSFVGLSPALGTFLAGVVLANSEYRHELESDIEPFKGLLLGLFFMTVGAGINFALLFDQLGIIVGLTLALMLIKVLVLLLSSYVFKIRGADRWLLALGLAQAGEFGFVLLSFTVANGVIPAALSEQLLLVVALSMLLTPALFILFDKVIVPWFVANQGQDADTIDEKGAVIIAGHGRFGGIINRILKAAGHETVVLDHHAQQLGILRKFGVKVFYGDASRPDLLEAAGIAEAAVLVVAIDHREQSIAMVKHVTKHYPHVHIVPRALNRDHVYQLYSAGADDIVRDYFDSAVRAGRNALEALGVHPFEAERQTRGFVLNDQYMMREVAALYSDDIPSHENEPYIKKVLELAAKQDEAMRGHGAGFGMRSDGGWIPPRAKNKS